LVPLGYVARWALGRLGPEAIVEASLRLGPHRLSLAKLRAAPHGLDLGPLEPRLPGRLATPDRAIQLAPKVFLDDVARLAHAARPTGLVMIGRRQLRSNNSWMHNSERLVKGPSRCTLMIHPDDAAARGLVDGQAARVASTTGAIQLPVEITDSVMRGVVSIPHGWGHGKDGVRLRVAASHPGASINDVIDPARVDALSGTSALSGQPVEVTSVAPAIVDR
jgi:anaerobic selenocysteine-containing dehydrogenase